MYKCIELDKEFSTKEELFSALRTNVKDIISIKKAQIHKSCEKGQGINCKYFDVSKAVETNKEVFSDDNYYYIATNTTLILDSHKDFHDNGLWNKTAKERNKKNYLVDTHKLSLSTTIARKEDVEIMVVELPFSALGKSYSGNTEALIYKVRKDKLINNTAKEWLDSGADVEASVKMQYVIIEFAMNSDLKEDATFKNNYDTYIDRIANKEDYEEANGEIQYFWIVKEAKNIHESSLVPFGSNEVTGQVKIEPSNDTQKQEEAVKDDTSHNTYFLI